MIAAAFWQGRRVLLTGHTGFKGGWAAVWLAGLGAKVTGLALAPEHGPCLFTQARIGTLLDHNIVDLRDPAAVAHVVDKAKPDIVLHMAAQPLVRRSYRAPVDTFGTNVLGTVHLLEALRRAPAPAAVLVVTSDKVYADDRSGAPHNEADRLGGRDPYSASKAMTEIATASYAQSFFDGVPVATARGGNVIGGGDYSEDRVLPDAWRAARASVPLVLRNPDAVRPWQHVLDCLSGYFAYVEHLVGHADAPRSLNFGPPGEAVGVETLAHDFLQALGGETRIVIEPDPNMVETRYLALDTGAARSLLPWRPRLDAQTAARWAADWYRRVDAGEDALTATQDQIRAHADA